MMPSLDQIDRFLTERFGPVADLLTLQAGGWSSAYGFVADGTEWVLRVGRHRDDFAKECVAATWQQSGLPVPEVGEVGDAFGCHYIVTRRHHGTKLADLETPLVPVAIERLVEVLAAIRRVELPGHGFGIWLAPEADAPAASWPAYLCSVADRDEERLVARRHFPDDDVDGLLPLYELHIALGELQYAAFREDVAAMDGATDRLERLIAGGERR